MLPHTSQQNQAETSETPTILDSSKNYVREYDDSITKYTYCDGTSSNGNFSAV